jgi:predicted DNA-binding protein
MAMYGNILRMKKTTVYLEEQQLRKLEVISSKTGAPVAELIRRAIDAYTKKER